jgi:hypothetical protein
MPWEIQPRDGRYCVVKKGASEPVPGGCHDSRAQAVKHQAALYANESRVAAIYEKLDEVEEVAAEEQRVAQEIRVVLEQPEGMTAAFVQALELVAERLSAGERLNEGLIASLQAAATPQIVVEPTPITVEAPNVTVAAPNVEVHPQIVMPAERRRVEFDRDAIGRITGATVDEG